MRMSHGGMPAQQRQVLNCKDAKFSSTQDFVILEIVRVVMLLGGLYVHRLDTTSKLRLFLI